MQTIIKFLLEEPLVVISTLVFLSTKLKFEQILRELKYSYQPLFGISIYSLETIFDKNGFFLTLNFKYSSNNKMYCEIQLMLYLLKNKRLNNLLREY